MKTFKYLFLIFSFFYFLECKPASPIIVTVDSVKYKIDVASKTAQVYSIMENCPSIKEIIIYDGVEYVVNSVKTYGGENIKNIILPSSIQTIENEGFYKCAFIESIVLSDNIDYIGVNAFNRSSLKFINIPKKLKRLTTYVFDQCRGFSQFTIPDNIEEIGTGAFRNWRNLTSLTIGRNVRYINTIAFQDCVKLEEIFCYAANPPSIYSDAFENSYPEYMTLHVLKGKKEIYENAKLWNTFGIIIDDLEVIENLELDQETLDMVPGEVFQMNAFITSEEINYNNLIWEISDPEVATVNEQGLIEALTFGTAYLKVTYGDVVAMCKITVNPILAEEIKLNSKKVELKKGSQLPLKATIYPDSTTDKTIIWNTTNNEVASVSEEGLVTAISAGEAVITATCGEASASCEVIVIDDSGVESLLDNPDSKISIYSTDGILIKKDCKVEDLKTLNKGIYIIVSGNERYKIYI